MRDLTSYKDNQLSENTEELTELLNDYIGE